MSRTFVRTALPFIVFPGLLFLAGRTMYNFVEDANLFKKLDSFCPAKAGSATYRLPYTTGLSDEADKFLCTLVSFFHAAMDDKRGYELVSYFLASGTLFFVLPAVEAHRKGRTVFNLLVTFPLITGLLCQTISVALTMPLYLLSLTLGSARKFTGSRITQGQAEAILFGTIVGILVPSAGMLFLKDPYVTAIWQLIPLWSAIARQIHLLFRSSATESGYKTIRLMYIGLFILASSTHVAVVWPKLEKLDDLSSFFAPPTTSLRKAQIGEQVIGFLKWDGFFAFASVIVASHWFADGPLQVAGIAVWNALVSMLFGPGAATLGLLIWRETKLNGPPPHGLKTE